MSTLEEKSKTNKKISDKGKEKKRGEEEKEKGDKGKGDRCEKRLENTRKDEKIIEEEDKENDKSDAEDQEQEEHGMNSYSYSYVATYYSLYFFGGSINFYNGNSVPWNIT